MSEIKIIPRSMITCLVT